MSNIMVICVFDFVYYVCVNTVHSVDTAGPGACGDSNTNDYLLGELRLLEEDAFQHLCIAESIQARHIG